MCECVWCVCVCMCAREWWIETGKGKVCGGKGLREYGMRILRTVEGVKCPRCRRAMALPNTIALHHTSVVCVCV